MRWMVAAATLAALVAGAFALRRPGHRAPAASPYVTQIESPVRGLSAQEVDDLLDGRGAGYARTAELNGYPGPMHALELADALGLAAGQRARIEAIQAAMRAEARRLGAQIVEQERRLARVFGAGEVSETTLRPLVDSLATRYGRLRATHLAAHVQTTAVLTPDQIARYNALRGYAPDHGGGGEHGHGG